MKVLLLEDGWEVAASTLEQAGARLASRTTYVEARAALARAARARRLSPRDLVRARAALDDRWDSIEVVELDDWLQRAAGEVADRFALRAFDAIHLASALEVEDSQLVVATWDERLRAAALDAGLAVAP